MFSGKSNAVCNNKTFSAVRLAPMHETTERLYKAARDLRGADTPSEVARLLGESQQTLKNWEYRGMSKQGILKAQAAIGCRAEWLTTGSGRMSEAEPAPMSGTGNVIPHHPDDELPANSIAIRVSRAKFSAGNGNRVVEFELEEESEPVIYQLAWLRREGLIPSKVRRFRVKNDSMEPFLYHDDSVLVNLAENDAARIIDGKVYAFRYGDDLRIKRLYRHLDGTLVLHSDNPNYKDEVVPPELAEEHITLVGRVRDKSGKGGL